MRIRIATSADAFAIARVHVLGWQSAYRGLISDVLLDGLSIERRASFWNAALNGLLANQRAFVAEAANEVIGFVVGGPSRDQDASGCGELQAIYVLPDHWDTGVGAALHNVCMDALRADTFTAATLWVVEGNERAARFYRRHGWAFDGARKVEVTRDGATLVEIRFRRELNTM